jgi:Peptidoglycan-binding protein, CsiV
MKLRDLILPACLLMCLPWAVVPAQQPPAGAEVVVPPEPHPAPQAAPAGPMVYNVEVIVFRSNTALGSPEDWMSEAQHAPAVPMASDGDAAGAAGEAGPGGRFLRVLSPAEFQLGDIEARLKSSGAYVPVAHLGWAQTASPWGSHQSLSLQQLGADNPQLSGTVTLERGQFLHLGFALNLAIANPPGALGAAPGTTFVLNDNHRVKLFDRNYYDSPAFGVIALVAPAQGARRAGR